MLDAFIIEELKRRERESERRRDEERPRLEIPIAPESPTARKDDDSEPKPERGVVIIDYSVDPDREPRRRGVFEIDL